MSHLKEYSILVLNGPNLNFLGKRSPKLYGSFSLDEINDKMQVYSKKYKLNFKLEFFFSNSESKIINFIQNSLEKSDGIIFNLGAYTHTSIAILDAMLLFPNTKKIEVHLSNIYKREAFRRNSPYHSIVDGVILGFGPFGYLIALKAMKNLLSFDMF